MKTVKPLSFALSVVVSCVICCSCANKVVDGGENLTGDLVLKESVRTGGQFAFLPLGIYMSVLDYDDGFLTVEISNQSGYTMTYGGEYYLQKKVGKEWVDLNLPEGFVFKDGAKQIKDLDENQEKYDLNIFGQLSAGEYRIKKTDMEASFVLLHKK